MTKNSSALVRTRQARRRAALGIILLSILAGNGCVSAPPQTVELSDAVLEQIGYIEKSHRQLVRAYFVQLEHKVNTFIDNEWAPDFLDRAIQNEDVQQQLEQIEAGKDIDTENIALALRGSGRFSESEVAIVVAALDTAKLQYRIRFAQLMLDFASAAMREINKIRGEWHVKLRDSESSFLSELDESYGDVRAGHVQLRAYLESVVEVTELQDQIAAELGVLKERDALLDGLVTLSDTLADGDKSLNQIIESVEKVRISADDEESEVSSTPPLDAKVMDNILDELKRNGSRNR